jgi:protein ImuA
MRSSTPLTLDSRPISTTSRIAIGDLVDNGLVWAASGRPKTEINFKNDPLSVKSSLPFAIPEVDDSLPTKGLRRGALHEFFYHDPLQPERRSTLIPTLLAQSAYNTLTSENSWSRNAPSRAIVWIGKRTWPTPYSLISPEHSYSAQEEFLNSILFIDPPSDKLTLWTLETALRSKAIGLVIAECPRISLTVTKRFELAARENGATALLLRDPSDLNLPSRAFTKWVMTPTPSQYDAPTWELSLAHMRGGLQKPLSWLIGIHEQSSSISMRALPRVVDQRHTEEASRARFGT